MRWVQVHMGLVSFKPQYTPNPFRGCSHRHDTDAHREYSQRLFGYYGMKTSHWYPRSVLETSSSPEHCRHKSGKQIIRECMHDDVYIPGQIWDSFLSRWVLHTRIPKDYISTRKTLYNYDSLTNLKEHIQNL